jgi:hypothetical protein
MVVLGSEGREKPARLYTHGYVEISKLMATAPKLVRMPAPRIDADLKAFCDEVLVPMLVRDALEDIRRENQLASERATVGNSEPFAVRTASDERGNV